MASSEPQKPSAPRISSGTPPAAAILAYASLLPLVVGLVLVLTGGVGALDAAEVSAGFIAYAALLLAFHAGARFGHALRVTGVTASVSVLGLPILVGFVALWLPDRPAFGLLAAAHAAQGAWDVWSADRAQLTPWYGRLRLATAPIAVLLLVAAVILMPAEV